MSELTLESLVSELDKRFVPVQQGLIQVETKLTSQEGQIQSLSKRLEKVEKSKTLKPAPVPESTKEQTPRKTESQAGKMAYNQVVLLSPPVRDKEGLTAALEEPVVDVLSPADPAAPQLSVGDGDLLPRPDPPGGRQCQSVVRPVESLGAGAAGVREDGHAGVEHPHHTAVTSLATGGRSRLTKISKMTTSSW